MVKRSHVKHPLSNNLNPEQLRNLAFRAIIELETPLGINASGKDDRYAAFFGRDSMITSLKLLRIHQKSPDDLFLRIIKNTLKTAVRFQGKQINLKSGEKPGKIIHEYREKGYFHLMKRPDPWYVYPDKTIRNYDSVDATPLFLILAAEYHEFAKKDEALFKQLLQAAIRAFNYLEHFSPKGGNKLFLEYQLHRTGDHGGLVNQGWMDSMDSVLIYGKPPRQPMALVEVQGYYYKALKLWSKILKKLDDRLSNRLSEKAKKLKEEFNKLFLMKSHDRYYFAQGLFDQKAIILEVRSNPGHCLWASVKSGDKYDSIIESKYIENIVKRLMEPDLFTSTGGIRTLSSESAFFDAFSYHNGSVWPFDNGLIAEGFENFGFKKEAEMIKKAVINAIGKFGLPVELYCVDADGTVKEYIEKSAHYGSHKQAWTTATILDFLT